jgi:membrane protein YqaA with SNARE-associated domain
MINDLMQILYDVSSNPFLYSIIFFVFCVLAAIILPLPVEIGLFVGDVHPIIKILILGAGKSVGSYFVFFIGFKVDERVKKSTKRFKRYGIFVKKMEEFVSKYGYYALYIIMSIPLMIDTVPLYLFSIYNKNEEGMSLNGFVLVNFFAGCTRAVIIFAVLLGFGVKLV